MGATSDVPAVLSQLLADVGRAGCSLRHINGAEDTFADIFVMVGASEHGHALIQLELPQDIWRHLSELDLKICFTLGTSMPDWIGT